MNPSETLKTHLCESAKNGSRSAIFFAQIALFTATIFVWKTRLYAEHDRTGFKTALSYQIIAILVSNSSRLSGLGFIRVTCGYKVNSIANLICLILAIVLEKFYEKSLSSLSFALSVTVLSLILLLIMQPSTDLGLFGFLIGVIGSVAYDLFGLKFQTWIVVAICFPLLGFRFWLDKNWLGEHPNRRPRGRNQVYKSLIIEELMVAGFHLFWIYNLFRINCPQKKGPPKSMSCTSISVMGMLAYVFIFNLWFGHALLSRVYSLFQTESQPEPEPQHKPEPEPQHKPGQPRMIMMRQPQPGQPGVMIMMRQRPLSMSSAQEGKEARPPLIMSSAQPLIMSSGQPLIMSSAQGGTCVYSLFQTEPELEQEAIAHKKED